MPNPQKPDRPAAWLTKQQMAEVLDVTVAYFDREVRRHARAEHVRRQGRRLLFYCRGVLDAWYASRHRGPVTPPDERELEPVDLLLMDLA